MDQGQTLSRYTLNPRAVREGPILPIHGWIGREAPTLVSQLLQLCPRHQPTPLEQLGGLAAELGLAKVFAKNEADRLGLGSFKALGGAYAVAASVLHWASQRLGRQIPADEIMSSQVLEAVKDQIVCCATAGNHGRSVAAGARLFGCRAVISFTSMSGKTGARC